MEFVFIWQVDEVRKRGEAATKKLEEELDALRHEKDLLEASSAELMKANEDLKRDYEEAKAALQLAVKSAAKASPTVTPTMSPSSSSNKLAAPDSLSSLSKNLNRRSVGKLDPKLLKIKHQLESGDGGPSSGDSAFYYEKGIDDNLLMFAKDSISTIMTGQGSIVYDDMPQLNQLFKFDTGRRLFCFMLQYAVEKVLFCVNFDYSQKHVALTQPCG
jgi:hypothetical protein